MAKRKCIHGKELGCCGYDELDYKPPTTTAMRPSKIGTKKLKGPVGLGSFDRPVYNISNLR